MSRENRYTKECPFCHSMCENFIGGNLFCRCNAKYYYEDKVWLDRNTGKEIWDDEQRRIDDKVKEQAKHYIGRIFCEIACFQRHGEINEPTIIMSRDVFNVLQAGSERALYVNQEFQTICGCKVDVVSGTQKLYVGLNLI